MVATIAGDEDGEQVPLLCSQRWILAYIGFLGFGVVYSLRVNISVAVVCMLKTINSTDASNDGNVSEPLDLECGALEKAASAFEVHADTVSGEDRYRHIRVRSFYICAYVELYILHHHFSRVMRKPVFGFSDQLRLKPVCFPTETS